MKEGKSQLRLGEGDGVGEGQEGGHLSSRNWGCPAPALLVDSDTADQKGDNTSLTPKIAGDLGDHKAARSRPSPWNMSARRPQRR